MLNQFHEINHEIKPHLEEKISKIKPQRCKDVSKWTLKKMS